VYNFNPCITKIVRRLNALSKQLGDYPGGDLEAQYKTTQEHRHRQSKKKALGDGTRRKREQIAVKSKHGFALS
jgi:hypothetical protein